MERLVEIPEEYLCPITQDIMNDPVMAADGHSYEKEAISSWLRSGRNNSPMTNLVLPHKTITENITLRNVINSFRENLSSVQREKQIKIDLQMALQMREEMIQSKMQKYENSNMREDKKNNDPSISFDTVNGKLEKFIQSKENFMRILKDFLDDFDSSCTCLNGKKLKFKVLQTLRVLKENNLINKCENFNDIIENKCHNKQEKREIEDPLDINSPFDNYIFNSKDESKVQYNQVVEKFTTFDPVMTPDINKLNYSFDNFNNDNNINDENNYGTNQIINNLPETWTCNGSKSNELNPIISKSYNSSLILNYENPNITINRNEGDLYINNNENYTEMNKNMKLKASDPVDILNIETKEENEDKLSCSVCREIMDLKISNFLKKALCCNCFFTELKSTLSFIISPKIENSLVSLFKEEKIFQPFDVIYNINENTPMRLFNHICEIKHYRDFLQIDFEGLIKKILTDNCLICFFADVRSCQPKNFIVLPCNCRFNSLNHFKIFISNLIKVNTEDKKLLHFTCLCNSKYYVTEFLKIFETINENSLHEEFHSLKTYLLNCYFKRFCCLCSKILTSINSKGKSSYFLRDNMIGMFLDITVFEHFACDECEIIIRNEKSKAKKENRPLVFPCNICNFEHFLES